MPVSDYFQTERQQIIDIATTVTQEHRKEAAKNMPKRLSETSCPDGWVDDGTGVCVPVLSPSARPK